MKKLLLTSTALVAFAGAAAAEIALTGSAEMGIAGGDAEVENRDGERFEESLPMQFWQDVDVTFTMSGETPGGLAFGVAVDLDEAVNLRGTEFDDHGVAVFISGDFGRVTMGDTDGALDFVTQDMGYKNPGSIDDAETGHLGYLGAWLDGSNDGQIVRYDYTWEGLKLAASVEQGGADSFGNNGIIVDGDTDLTWSVGAAYEFDFGGGDVGASLGYQYSDNGRIAVGGTADDANISFQLNAGEVAATALGVYGDFGGFGAALTYTWFDFDDGDDVTHIGVGGGYEFDAFSIHANYGVWESDSYDIAGWGIAGAYDLGGGASLHAAYGSSSADEDDSPASIDLQSYSFGLAFSF